MSDCSQEEITDAAFALLTGIHTLNMSGCSQPTITDAAFVRLRGIHTLDMAAAKPGRYHCCSLPPPGVHSLRMGQCAGITDASFVHLRGLHELDMSLCTGITDAAHLSGIESLCMRAAASTTSLMPHSPTCVA